MTDRHRNDIYGDLEKTEASPAIPAATVVLVRENPELEVLMLQKNANISFGGMWVFPGGKIDRADYVDSDDVLLAAKQAAVRETEEETGLQLQHDEFQWFAHWTPPPSTPKRYATWFFVARLDEDDEVRVDGQEILNHQWISPRVAHEKHAAGEIDLAPPTWITLYQLDQFDKTEALMSYLQREQPRYYETRIVKDSEGQRIALWSGDDGYETGDAEAGDRRHRLNLGSEGFVFLNTHTQYQPD